MKKIILCLGFIATLMSCSSDPDPYYYVSNDLLVKEVQYTSITDDYTEKVVYTYNGNKLIKGVYDDGSEEIYTYQGNLITKIQLITDGEMDTTETYSYDSNGRLVGYLFEEDSYTDQETFTYNGDGTVTSTISSSGGAASTRTLYFQNDELSKIVGSGRTYNYTYDSKNSPFRNVTGYDKIAFVSHGDHEFFGQKQNIATIYESVDDVDYMTNTMTYNANNYPLTASSEAIFESVPSSATIQYTYY